MSSGPQAGWVPPPCLRATRVYFPGPRSRGCSVRRPFSPGALLFDGVGPNEAEPVPGEAHSSSFHQAFPA